tara:strand:- start:49 stop:597 length:549 start_codon:yes stop_codon:yes gene_type:complete
MDFNDVFKLRRTIHDFNSKVVHYDSIKRSIEAANLAPCHRLTFPWRFKNIRKDKRERLFEISFKIKQKNGKLSEDMKKKLYSKLMKPSHLIVVSQIKHGDSKIENENYAACSCSIQNMMLSLANEGIGSKWSTGKVIEHNETYKAIQINQDKETIIGFIYIGYGKIPPKIKRPKLSLILNEI